MRKSISVFFLMYCLVGCGVSGPTQNGIGIGKLVTGTEQGNGLISYHNEKMGVGFEYPTAWRLTESSDRSFATLDNSHVARSEGEVSRIEFSIAPAVFGERFIGIHELRKFLLDKWPSRDWKEISLSSGQEGFSWKSQDGFFEVAEYYLLDRNYNVLSIRYRAQAGLGGAAVIKAIVASMTVDTTPPVVERIYFEPSVAGPGQKVKLVVEAQDEIGEIDLTSLSNRALSLPNEDRSRFNANIPTLSMGYLIPYRGGTAGLHNAYPLNSLFTREGGNRYSHEFIVPAGAPDGVITVPDFRVADSNGQEVYFTIDPSRYEMDRGERIYSSHYEVSASPDWGLRYSAGSISAKQKPVPRPELRVNRGAVDGPADSTPPLIKRAWFEKTLVNSSNPGTQKLYLQVEEQSPLALAKVEFNAICYLGRNAVPRYLGSGTYEIDLGNGASGCNPSDHPSRTTVVLKRIVVVDEAGNILDHATFGDTRAAFIIQR